MGPSGVLALGLLLQLTGLSAGLQNRGCRQGGGVENTLQTQGQREAQRFQHDVTCALNDTREKAFCEETIVRHGGRGELVTSQLHHFYEL
jgi:hypothetical protein